MIYSKKLLSIATAILLIVSIGTAIPVKADTYVDVDTTGNVQLLITTDGTVNLIYNGVNIQAEINGLYSGLNSIGHQMNALASETNSALNGLWLRTGATRTDVANLNQTVFQLIGELDTILEDLFGRTTFLAQVIGINANSSTVVTNLKSGTQTVAGYLDSILATLDDVGEDIAVLEDAIDKIHQRLDALESFDISVSEQLNMTEQEIESLTNYTEEQRTLIRLQITALEAFVDTKVLELNEQREALREDVQTDLTALETLIQEGKDRQLVTEIVVRNLQKRLSDAENNLDRLIIISGVLIIALACVAVLSIVTRKHKNLP